LNVKAESVGFRNAHQTRKNMTTDHEPKKLKVVGIRLDDEMYRELKALADAEDRKFASFIVVALKRYIAGERASRGISSTNADEQ
jgi:hypothetical protein